MSSNDPRSWRPVVAGGGVTRHGISIDPDNLPSVALRVLTTEAAIAGMEADITLNHEEHGERLNQIEAAMRELGRGLTSTHERLATLTGQVTTFTDRVTNLTDRVATLTDRVTTLTAQRLQFQVDNMNRQVANQGGQLDGLEEYVGGLHEQWNEQLNALSEDLRAQALAAEQTVNRYSNLVNRHTDRLEVHHQRLGNLEIAVPKFQPRHSPHAPLAQLPPQAQQAQQEPTTQRSGLSRLPGSLSRSFSKRKASVKKLFKN